jgi:organic hydroperoxide reductase OsmC/OhrA
MSNEHKYSLTIQWTGNTGNGTAGYNSYERSHSILIDGKDEIKASSDPAFRGDGTKHNPEELLLASLSSCHMLWFLNLCSGKGIIVTAYVDKPSGTMTLTKDGSGKFTEVVLNPTATVEGNISADVLSEIHQKAHKMCFIANSVNFPVRFGEMK